MWEDRIDLMEELLDALEQLPDPSLILKIGTSDREELRTAPGDGGVCGKTGLAELMGFLNDGNTGIRLLTEYKVDRYVFLGLLLDHCRKRFRVHSIFK